jgi:four helix bundle protein
MELAEHCYRLTAGHNHGSTAVFIRHVAIALGSQAEAETQLELAWRLGFVTAESR